jgi:hypothetical protein
MHSTDHSISKHHGTVALSLLCVLQAYDELTAKLRELDALNGISGLLGWDELVRSSSSSSTV